MYFLDSFPTGSKLKRRLSLDIYADLFLTLHPSTACCMNMLVGQGPAGRQSQVAVGWAGF